MIHICFHLLSAGLYGEHFDSIKTIWMGNIIDPNCFPARKHIVVVPIPEYSEGNTRLQGKTYWNISAGVRRGEDDRRQMVEEAIFRNLDKIYAIMDEYGIPHTEPIFVDRLDGYKRHKK